MKQRKRDSMWVRFCARKKVSGPEEDTADAGRNSTFPVMTLRIE